jgi:hypothetical protein
MAKLSLSSIKSKFQTGDRPTQEDYVDLIDTLAGGSTDLGSTGNNENTIQGITNPTVFDNFDGTVWRMVKYLISIKKTSAGDNKFYATELTVLIDGTDISASQYGMIDNDGDIGTVTVSKSGSNVTLVVTPNPGVTPITVRFARMGLKA